MKSRVYKHPSRLDLHFIIPKLKNLFNSQIMVTHQRSDLHMNIPALRKLDAMLIVSSVWTVVALQLMACK